MPAATVAATVTGTPAPYLDMVAGMLALTLAMVGDTPAPRGGGALQFTLPFSSPFQFALSLIPTPQFTLPLSSPPIHTSSIHTPSLIPSPNHIPSQDPQFTLPLSSPSNSHPSLLLFPPPWWALAMVDEGQQAVHCCSARARTYDSPQDQSPTLLFLLFLGVASVLGWWRGVLWCALHPCIRFSSCVSRCLPPFPPGQPQPWAKLLPGAQECSGTWQAVTRPSCRRSLGPRRTCAQRPVCTLPPLCVSPPPPHNPSFHHPPPARFALTNHSMPSSPPSLTPPPTPTHTGPLATTYPTTPLGHAQQGHHEWRPETAPLLPFLPPPPLHVCSMPGSMDAARECRKSRLG